ncbi:unnamed protein product [Blepharisma stoltei]|uniref:DNA/RNA-binding protein Alba-like domain-containing protein n=1 Tax=Blepharisma stoltei TaxID=1481888 RepID=A0AAU9KGN2_9CILI|nr:unnamed protein product [Blepharisma stoltei]
MESEESIIKVSVRNNPGTYIFEGKEKLKAKGSVSFHAIGGSIVNAVKASDRLVSLGYATLTKFETSCVDEKDFDGKPRKVYKVVLQLARTPEFDNIYEQFEKNKTKK